MFHRALLTRYRAKWVNTLRMARVRARIVSRVHMPRLLASPCVMYAKRVNMGRVRADYRVMYAKRVNIYRMLQRMLHYTILLTIA